MEIKTVIETKDMDYKTRDLEVMLVFLKILIFYAEIDKALTMTRWQEFFCIVFPDAVVDDNGSKAVYSLATAKKFLEGNNYIEITKPRGKKYYLIKLASDRLQKVAEVLVANGRAYDEQLLKDIKQYMEEKDSGKGGKFKDSNDAFASIGL